MSTQTEPDQYLEVHGAHLRWRLAGHGPAIMLLDGAPCRPTGDGHAQRLLERIVARYRGSDLQQQVERGGAPDLGAIAAQAPPGIAVRTR